MLIAGEASGDLLGARLITSLKNTNLPFKFSGIGGKEMLKAGIESILPMKEISSSGFFDVVMRAPALLLNIRKIANAVIETNPSALIIIDSYDFNHRVAKKVFSRASHIPIINYAPPKAWGWRSGRAKKMEKYIRACLNLFPFEAKFFGSYGIESFYVGHPAIEHVASEENAVKFRARFGKNKKLILIALGSRKRELKYMAKIFGDTIELIKKLQPETEFEFIVPIAENISDETKNAISAWKTKPIIVETNEEKLALFKAADIALVTSGTIILELGVSQTPAICAYRLNPIEEWIISKLANLEMVSLVNLILERKEFAEILGKKPTTPKNIAEAGIELLKTDSTKALLELNNKLKTPKPPSEMAALAVSKILNF